MLTQSWPIAVLCLPPLLPEAKAWPLYPVQPQPKVNKASPRFQSWVLQDSSFISQNSQWSLFLSYNHPKHPHVSSSKSLLRNYPCCPKGLLPHAFLVVQQSQIRLQTGQMGAALGVWMLRPFFPPPKLKPFEPGIPKLKHARQTFLTLHKKVLPPKIPMLSIQVLLVLLESNHRLIKGLQVDNLGATFNINKQGSIHLCPFQTETMG